MLIFTIMINRGINPCYKLHLIFQLTTGNEQSILIIVYSPIFIARKDLTHMKSIFTIHLIQYPNMTQYWELRVLTIYIIHFKII